MPAESTDTTPTHHVCPDCSGPLVVEAHPGRDWLMLSCPECQTSHKWRGTPIGIGMRVFMILLFSANLVLMVVDAGWRDDSFRQLLAVAGLVIIAWAVVGLVQMARAAAAWKR